MKIGACLALGLAALAAQSCREKAALLEPAPTRAANATVTRTALAPSSVSGARRIEIDPRAQRVCELVQREPAQRKADCCGSAAPSDAFDECTRRLSLALDAKAVDIDSSALAACTVAAEAHYAGCDWVTPSQPLPPPACQALVSGKLQDGAMCRSSLECVSPLHCKGATPSEPGHCAPPEPVGAACHTGSDALGAALMVMSLDATHPTCQGTCSAASRRCEPASAQPTCEGSKYALGRKTRSAAAGDACENDFDCAEGGCGGEPKHCGMKCAISFARGAASKPALVLPRRTALASGPR